MAICAMPDTAAAEEYLQYVPYARIVSGIDIHGDALHWRDQAEGRYERDHTRADIARDITLAIPMRD